VNVHHELNFEAAETSAMFVADVVRGAGTNLEKVSRLYFRYGNTHSLVAADTNNCLGEELLQKVKRGRTGRLEMLQKVQRKVLALEKASASLDCYIANAPSQRMALGSIIASVSPSPLLHPKKRIFHFFLNPPNCTLAPSVSLGS
jgi:hypothetical protein